MPSPEERINVLEQRADKIEANASAGFMSHSDKLLDLKHRIEALEAPPPPKPPNPVLVKLKAGWAKLKAKLPSWQTLLVLAAAGFMFAKSQGCELPIPWPPPTPDVDPVPIPKAGLRVLLVEESADRQTHTAAFLGSQEIRKYMAEKCAKGPDGKTPEFRVYDKDNPGESPVWQEALKLPRTELPWLIISNPPKGYAGPLPKTGKEQLELLKKYGG